MEWFLEDFFEVGCKIRAAGEIKSFSVQQFFKNAAEVWASSPHLRSKLDLQVKLQQKSKRESEESQLPSKSGGCNKHTRFQGQLRFPGKLGMCPSLAEPDSNDFSKTSHRQKTFLSPAARYLQPIIQKSSCFFSRSRCFFCKISQK